MCATNLVLLAQKRDDGSMTFNMRCNVTKASQKYHVDKKQRTGQQTRRDKPFATPIRCHAAWQVEMKAPRDGRVLIRAMRPKPGQEDVRIGNEKLEAVPVGEAYHHNHMHDIDHCDRVSVVRVYYQ